MEYQNGVGNLTEFAVAQGTPLWIGRVDPGDRRAVLGGYSGTQVYIERSYITGVREVETQALLDDLGKFFVYPGRLPRVGS
jgi:hypothetical protein